MYEIYDVELPEDIWSDLLNHSENEENPKVILASKEEIATDTKFGSHTKHIL